MFPSFPVDSDRAYSAIAVCLAEFGSVTAFSHNLLIPVLCRLSYLYQDTLLTPAILKLGNFPDSFDAVRKERASDAHGGVFIAYIDFEMYMCSRRLIKRFTRSFWVSQPWELIRRQQKEGVTCKYLMGYKKTVSAATFGYYRRALSNSSYKHTNAQ